MTLTVTVSFLRVVSVNACHLSLCSQTRCWMTVAVTGQCAEMEMKLTAWWMAPILSAPANPASSPTDVIDVKVQFAPFCTEFYAVVTVCSWRLKTVCNVYRELVVVSQIRTSVSSLEPAPTFATTLRVPTSAAATSTSPESMRPARLMVSTC